LKALPAEAVCQAEGLVASGRYHTFGAASACPEIVISIAIDAVKAIFFVIVLFPCCAEYPIAGNAHRRISKAHARGVDVGFSIDRTIKFRFTRRCVADVYPRLAVSPAKRFS
jgi:hypothetical protein